MAEMVLLYGRSGTGKSCSARNFENLFVINVNGKKMPYRALKSQVVWSCNDYSKIKEQMTKAVKKGYNSILLDDAGYLMTNEFMSKPSNLVGNSVFQYYDKLGKNFFDLTEHIKYNLPEDVLVYVVMHEDLNDNGYSKLRTIGRQLDEKVCIEGLATIALRSMKREKRYVFCTNTDGLDITKSPMGMFNDLYIDNDLKAVDDTIREFWGLKPSYNPPKKEEEKVVEKKENIKEEK